MGTNYKYIVLSPDGITIEYDRPYYTSMKKAEQAFEIWKKRYEFQGYYSTNGKRISLEDLKDYCSFIKK
jgi:hypothetical protein